MRIFLTLLFLSPLLQAAGTGDDCAKTPDACAPRQGSSTPFIAALKNASAPKPAPAAKETAPAPAPAPAASVPAPSAAQDAAPEKKTFSRPGWSAAGILLLLGLYFFLKEGKKRKGRK